MYIHRDVYCKTATKATVKQTGGRQTLGVLVYVSPHSVHTLFYKWKHDSKRFKYIYSFDSQSSSQTQKVNVKDHVYKNYEDHIINKRRYNKKIT